MFWKKIIEKNTDGTLNVFNKSLNKSGTVVSKIIEKNADGTLNVFNISLNKSGTVVSKISSFVDRSVFKNLSISTDHIHIFNGPHTYFQQSYLLNFWIFWVNNWIWFMWHINHGFYLYKRKIRLNIKLIITPDIYFFFFFPFPLPLFAPSQTNPRKYIKSLNIYIQ